MPKPVKRWTVREINEECLSCVWIAESDYDRDLKEARDHLQALHDLQNGPPLPTYTAAWNEIMDKVEAFLARTEAP